MYLCLQECRILPSCATSCSYLQECVRGDAPVCDGLYRVCQPSALAVGLAAPISVLLEYTVLMYIFLHFVSW